MSNDSFMGTHFNISYLKMKDNKRRHRARCKYFIKETKSCRKTVLRCIGSSRCMYYSEKSEEKVIGANYIKGSSSRVVASKRYNKNARAEDRIPEDFILLDKSTELRKKVVKYDDIVILNKSSNNGRHILKVVKSGKVSCPTKKVLGEKLKSIVLIAGSIMLLKRYIEVKIC